MVGRLITLHALTSVHAGTGTSASYIDLPFQREVHTELPVIHSSGIRGVFRDEELKKVENCDELKKFVKIFGGGVDVAKFLEKKNKENDQNFVNCNVRSEPSDSASSISFTDARILFFPVRSLKGVIAWITSPFVVERFKRDLEIIGIEINNLNMESLKVNDLNVVLTKDSDLKIKNNFVVFEDFRLNVSNENNFNVSRLKDYIPDSIDFTFFEKHVAVVSDDVFKDLTKLGAEITPRIRIDKEKGTVASGALWYEENVPSEAIFYSLVISETNNSLEFLDKYSGKVIQFGGNESIGRGLFKITITSGGEKR